MECSAFEGWKSIDMGTTRLLFASSTTTALAATLACASVQPAAAQQSAVRPFWSQIRSFLVEDEKNGLLPCRTVFVGSSSIRLWPGLAADMPGRPVIQRGFGGAQLSHVRRYYDVLIGRHRPRAIVLYAGENDISSGASPARVLSELNALLESKARTLGATPVYYISIKPSLQRWHEFATQTRANTMIKNLAATRADLVFIDVVQVMLRDGQPRGIYVADGLHLNRTGYRLWAQAVNKALDTAAVATPLHCRRTPNR